MPVTPDRFDTVSENYGRFRPSYPVSLMHRLAECFEGTGLLPGIWIDVGCGTGIFTRQLATILPPDISVIGLEPSAAMRENAGKLSAGANVEYRDGTAEALPAGDGTVSGVSAATAAHWFDRPRFYAEAVRVLKPGGILAVVQYVRDLAASPAATALDAYMNEMGGPKAYERPNYRAELANVRSLKTPVAWSMVQTLCLSTEGYVGLALSSSHSAAIVARLGEARVRADLHRLAERHMSAEGFVPFGYRFDVVMATRACQS